jgi:hypothetical protein
MTLPIVPALPAVRTHHQPPRRQRQNTNARQHIARRHSPRPTESRKVWKLPSCVFVKLSIGKPALYAAVAQVAASAAVMA